MKNKNQVIILCILLIVLTSFAWNPVISDTMRTEVITQLQETFGGLFGGTGSLSLAKLVSAGIVIVIVWLANIAICYLLAKNIFSVIDKKTVILLLEITSCLQTVEKL